MKKFVVLSPVYMLHLVCVRSADVPRVRPHEFWCNKCETIKTKADFLYRGNGQRRSYCNECRKLMMKEYWHSRGGKEKKREYLSTNNGMESLRKREIKKRKDPLFSIKKKARAEVQKLVNNGIIPAAKFLKCVDCDSMAKEYDHYLGYDKINWLNVQPVCWICHSIRTKEQNNGRKPQGL